MLSTLAWRKPMRQIAIFALASGLLFGASACQSDSNASAPAHPDLAQRTAKVVSEVPLPGLAVFVIKQGKVDIAVAGNRNIERPSPMAIADPVALGSNGKAITATLLARLVEHGLLRWDSTLAELLPELVATADPAYAQVTVEMLLRHRSGLSPLVNSTDIAAAMAEIGPLTGNLALDQRTVARWALSQPPRFTPGGQFEYGNLDYLLAGIIAEHVGGADYVSLVQSEVFAPLGMRGQIGVPAGGISGHVYSNNGWHALALAADVQYLISLSEAAGGWAMSMADYARFVQAHIDGLAGKSTLLSQASFQKLHDAKAPDNYSMGWIELDTPAGRMSAHGGSDDMSYQMAALFSQQSGKAVALFVNGYSGPALQAVDKFGGELIRE